jgi:hypothetical protein
MRAEYRGGETHMKMVTWAVGSVLLSASAGLVIAAVMSAAPPARAAELPGCPHAHAAWQATPKTAHPAPATSGHHDYLIATRMGWAIG